MVLCETCTIKDAKFIASLNLIEQYSTPSMDVTVNHVQFTSSQKDQIPQKLQLGLHIRVVEQVRVDRTADTVTLVPQAYYKAIENMTQLCTVLERLLVDIDMDGYIAVLQTEYVPDATCVTIVLCMRQFNTATAPMIVEPRNPKSTPKQWDATQGWKKVHWFACAGSAD